MTRKVFRGRHLAAGDRPADEQRRKSGHALRILAERSCVDYRIRWIVVDVDNRREVDVNSSGAPFLCDRAADVVRVGVTSGGGDCHRRGKHGGTAGVEHVVREDAALESAESGLEIGADEEWDGRAALKVIHLRGDFDGSAK